MAFTALDPGFSVSPQLRPDELRLALEAGFNMIVNNRPDGEEAGQPTSEELRAEALRLGLDYVHIPVKPGQMTDSDARELGELLAGPGRRLLAFCRTGARSTSLWKRSHELAALGG